jgi:hypothetical protein
MPEMAGHTFFRRLLFGVELAIQFDVEKDDKDHIDRSSG